MTPEIREKLEALAADLGRLCVNGRASREDLALLDHIIPFLPVDEEEAAQADFDRAYQAGYAYACGYHD